MPRLSVLELADFETDGESLIEEIGPRVPNIDETILAEQINQSDTGQMICALFVAVVCGAIVGIAVVVGSL